MTALNLALLPISSRSTTFRMVMPPSEFADNLRQKPGAAFRLVDPGLNQAGCGDVTIVSADFMGGAQIACQLQVVVAKLRQHGPRSDSFFIVILEALVTRDIADRAQGRSADLAGTFRDIVAHGKDLLRVLVQQQMIVTEMAPGHVPMEIL